jgi:hypothetical protein
MIQRLVQRYTQGQRQAVRGYGSRWRSAHSGKQSQGEKKDKDFEDVLVENPTSLCVDNKGDECWRSAHRVISLSPWGGERISRHTQLKARLPLAIVGFTD